MANLYSPESLGIRAPAGGFQNLGWYSGRQYVNGTLSDPGVIHPQSTQVGAGQAVSASVNAASAATQGVTPQQFDQYLAGQSKKSAAITPTATVAVNPNQPQTPVGPTDGMGTGTGTGVGLGSIGAPATIDLPKIYQSLFDSSGISTKQEELSAKQKAYNDAMVKINDNPFYSEATRVGRGKKLTDQFTNDVQALQNDIATTRADIQMKLDLQTKQFDINSQATKDAWTQFNQLLSSGALVNANGEDIANITRATGIPSTMIQSAISASKVKDVKTSVIQSTDDKGNVTVSVINSETGDVIKQSSLGAIGNAQKGSATDTVKQASANVISFLDARKNSYGHVGPDDWAAARSAFITDGGTAQQFNSNFASYTDPNRGDFNSSYGFDIKSRGASQYQILNQQ